jgi:hypothetical protein
MMVTDMTDAIQKAREALTAAQDTLTAASRQLTNDHKIVLGGKRWGEATIAKIDAALAALDAPAEGETLSRECATEGCRNQATIHFIRGDVGSHYCRDCYMRVQALVPPEARS